MTEQSNDPIESYLDALFVQMHDQGPSARRMLAETESHLRDAVDRGIDSGLSREAAQQQAVEQFGSAKVVAKATRRGSLRAVAPQLTAELVTSMWRLGSIGLMSIAASAGVALAFVAAFGKSFVFGATPADTTSSTACAYWLKIQPQAHTCAQAFTAESFQDGLMFRIAFGLIGIAALFIGLIVKRRRPRRTIQLVSDVFTKTVGLTVFGTAAICLAAYGADQIVLGYQGAGKWLSAAVCAGVVAAYYMQTLFRHVLNQSVALQE